MIPVAIGVGDEGQPVGNTFRRIFGMMGDEQQLRAALSNQDINPAPHQLAVERIQSLQRLIKNKQRRMFDQRAGN